MASMGRNRQLDGSRQFVFVCQVNRQQKREHDLLQCRELVQMQARQDPEPRTSREPSAQTACMRRDSLWE